MTRAVKGERDPVPHAERMFKTENFSSPVSLSTLDDYYGAVNGDVLTLRVGERLDLGGGCFCERTK